MYQPRKDFRSEFVPIRGLSYHVRHWGEPVAGQPPLVMMHGWMDVGASFQFVVDEMAGGRHIIAPDWRGYGLTHVPATDNYWFADYMADLDALLDHFSPDAPVDLLGHSLGGSVVMMYAGIRPQRIRRLINLEGFGGADIRPAQVPGRFARWMDEMREQRAGRLALKPYASADDVAARLMKTNRRLPRDKADWLARHWARQETDGQWRILADDAHKVIGADPWRADEVLANYARITAPVLVVQASDNELDNWWKGKYTLADFHERLRSVPQVSVAHIDDAGHMLHHDQPAQLARLIAAHLDGQP